MRFARVAAVLLFPGLFSTAGFAAEPKIFTPATSAAEFGKIAARFNSELKCGDAVKKSDPPNPMRVWCAVGQTGNAPLVVPKDITTFVGIAAEVHDGKPLSSVLGETTSPAALHLGPKTAIVTYIKPSNDEEAKQLVPVVMEIGTALKDGMKQPLTLPKDLVSFLAGERLKPGHDLTFSGQKATFAGKLPAEIRRVGEVYVVIELAEGGGFVSLLPIAGQTPR